VAIADDPRSRSGEFVECGDRRVGTYLLDDADERVDHDHQNDDSGVRQIPEDRGDHGSDDEQGDQRVSQLAADAAQQTSRRRSGHDVRTVHGEPLGGLGHGETTRADRGLRVHDASSRRQFSDSDVGGHPGRAIGPGSTCSDGDTGALAGGMTDEEVTGGHDEVPSARQ